VIMAQKRHQLRRAVKCVHEVLGRLGLRLHGSKRLIGKLSKGFDFLGYRVVPGRRLRSSAESKRRFAEKFRRLYEQGASSMRLWRYAERWCRWRRSGLTGLVSLKGGLQMPRPEPGRCGSHQPRAESASSRRVPTYSVMAATRMSRGSTIQLHHDFSFISKQHNSTTHSRI